MGETNGADLGMVLYVCLVLWVKDEHDGDVVRIEAGASVVRVDDDI